MEYDERGEVHAAIAYARMIQVDQAGDGAALPENVVAAEVAMYEATVSFGAKSKLDNFVNRVVGGCYGVRGQQRV